MISDYWLFICRSCGRIRNVALFAFKSVLSGAGGGVVCEGLMTGDWKREPVTLARISYVAVCTGNCFATSTENVV